MNLKYIKSIVASCYLIVAASFSTSAAEWVSASTTKVEMAQNNAKHVIHTVAKGETIYSIARLYNVSIGDIYVLNPSTEKGLKLNEKIKIPTNSSPATSVASTSAKSYTVKSKETLYSISKQFDVKVDDLINANPELRSKPLTKGQSLVLPTLSANKLSQVPAGAALAGKSHFIEHNVTSKETLYSIAKEYNTTPEAITDFNPSLKSGLKSGVTILIPVLQSGNSAPAVSTSTSSTQTHPGTLMDVDAIKIGLVLPFVNKSQGKSARFVEYYEGFLLALNEMKAKGLSANVYVFDMASETGTAKLTSLLETNEMKDLDLIVGGVSAEQITVISDFAKKQGINYAIPFPTKTDETQNNKEVFQLNSPHEILYTGAAKAFADTFGNANVIYITETAGSNDKKDFIVALSNQLAQRGMKANYVVANQGLASDLSLALDRSRKNVIVAASGSAQLLQNLLPTLNSIREQQPTTSISLYGHTEWQTYTQFFSDFYKNDTYIFTPFYLSDDDYKTKQFVSSYQKWYNKKPLINTYPKYGVLGYDTGIYFLTALQKHGKNFASAVNSISVPTLQTPMYFDKTASGGYMNNGFYIIHYKANASVEKTEYGK